MSTMHEKRDMILRVEVGEAKDEETGVVYELSHSMDGHPLVRSSKTGRTFSLGWQDIVEQAVAAGVDEESE